MKNIIFLTISLFFSISFYGQDKVAADSAYVSGDYIQAISLYESMLAEGESSEVYYNLGNSYFKADMIGKAILNYERALLLSPGNSDYRANLDIARSKTQDNLVSVPDVFFVVWFRSLINMLSVRQWSYIGICMFLLLLICLGCYFFARTVGLKKVGFILASSFFLLTILANLFAYTQKNKLIHRDNAIVLSPSITVRSTPSESGTSLFILHEGSKVKIKDDSMREWKEIQLPDGKVGWIPESAMEII